MPMAKTRWGQIVVALVVMVAWLIPVPASGARAADAFKMGVIDPQMVLEKSKAGRKALDGLKEYVSTRQKLLSRDEEELRNTEKTLKESKLSEGEKKEKEGPRTVAISRCLHRHGVGWRANKKSQGSYFSVPT